jgi:hypothetical protein
MLYPRDIPHRCDTEVISANALWGQLYRFATTRPSDNVPEPDFLGLGGAKGISQHLFGNAHLEARSPNGIIPSCARMWSDFNNNQGEHHGSQRTTQCASALQ